MADTIYCMEAGCPFKDCEHHITKAVGKGQVRCASLSGTCRDYIGYLVDVLRGMEGEKTNGT